MKIAVVTPIPTPYRDPFWNALAQAPGVELSVFYCSAGKADRPWRDDWEKRYDAQILRGWNLLRWRGADAACFVNPSIIRHLAAGDWDAILVGGYNHLTMWATMQHAVRRSIPFYLMCETYRTSKPGLRGLIRDRALRWIARHAAGGLPTGVRAQRFLESHGFAEDRLFRVPNVPDVAALHSRAIESAPLRGEIRMRLKLPATTPVALFAARLIPKKRVLLLLKAFADVRRHTDTHLAIVGDGPQRGEAEALVHELQLRDAVTFAGFVQPDQMPQWYAAADLFVLPSSETWGVVVIEALASGLPVIVTDEVGCCEDVGTDHGMMRTVRAGDQPSLTAEMTGVLGELPSKLDLGERWQAKRNQFSYSRLTAGLQSFLSRHSDALGHRASVQGVQS